MRAVLLLLLVGPRPFCRPVIPPGPAAAVLAAEPVTIDIAERSAGDNAVIDVYVRAGSATDPIGSEGLASLVAHTIQAQAQDDTQWPGAALSIDIGTELVRYRARCDESVAVLCASRLASAIAAPDWTYLGPVRSEVTAQLQGDVANDDLAARIAIGHLYYAHPYGHAAVGRERVVATVNAIQATAFHDTHYTRGSTRVGVQATATTAASVRGALSAPLSTLPTHLPADAPLQALLASITPQAWVVETRTAPASGAVAAPLSVHPGEPDFLLVWVGVEALFPGSLPIEGWQLNRAPHVLVRAPMDGRAEPSERLYWTHHALLDVLAAGIVPGALPAATDRVRERLSDPGWHTATALLFDESSADTRVLDALTVERVDDALRTWIRPQAIVLVAVTPDAEVTRRQLIEEYADDDVSPVLHTVRAEGITP